MKEVRKTINSILKEVLNESFSSEKVFKTDKVDLDLYLNNVLGEDDYFTHNSKATIYWSLEVSDAGWGVSSMYPVIKRMVLDIEVHREETDEFEKIEKEYNLGRAVDGDDINGFKLEITKTGDRDRVAPVNVTIYEDHKKIDIDFDYP
jgi:hypothetical protein